MIDDCFKGIKTDITSDDGAIDLLADIQQWVSASKLEDFTTDQGKQESLKAFIEQLTPISKKKEFLDISGGTKYRLSRMRTKLLALDKLFVAPENAADMLKLEKFVLKISKQKTYWDQPFPFEGPEVYDLYTSRLGSMLMFGDVEGLDPDKVYESLQNLQHLASVPGMDEKSHYPKLFGLKDEGLDVDQAAKYLAQRAFSEAKPVTLVHKAGSSLVPELRSTADPSKQITAGIHTKQVMIDASGDSWMFKPTAGVGEDFRVDVEHGTHGIAELFGFDMAESHIVEIDGKYGQLQKLVKHDGDLLDSEVKFSGPDYTRPTLARGGLTKRERRELARQHVLDWVMDNDDSHGGNMLRVSGSLLPIDKGRAYKHLGTRPLELDYLNAQSRSAYKDLYDFAGQDAEDLDAVFALVKATIGEMAQVDRAEYRKQLRVMFKDRPRKGSQTLEDLIDVAVARLDSLDADFDKLYDEIYATVNRKRPTVVGRSRDLG